MDVQALLTKLDVPPRWASNWCYFYLLASALLGLTSFLTLILLIFTYSSMKKGDLIRLVVYSIALVFQAIGAIVMFWMCRSSLNTKN